MRDMNADYEKKNGITRIVAFVRENETFELSTSGGRVSAPNANAMQLSSGASTSAMGGDGAHTENVGINLDDTPIIDVSSVIEDGENFTIIH